MRNVAEFDHSRRPWLLSAAASIGLAGLAGPAAALEYEGFEVPESLKLGGVPLVLNGIGIRAVSILKGYSAALYLSEKSTQVAGVLANTGPKRIQIRMLLQVGVGAEEFVKAINKGVARNCTEPERAAVAERIERFNNILRSVGTVYRKDLINLDYLPGSGLVLTVNGKVSGEPVPGADVYAAVLKVFLGERPVDKRLKAGMLGLPVT